MISAAARRLARRLAGPAPARRRGRRRAAARTADVAGLRAPEVLEDRALLSNITVNLFNEGAEYVVADGVQCVTFVGVVDPDETDFTIDASNVTNELLIEWGNPRTGQNAGFAAPAGSPFGGVDGEEISLTVTGNEEGAGLTFDAFSDVVVTEFEFTGTNADDELIGNIYCTREVFADDGEQESDGGDLTVELLEGDNSTLQADLRTGAEFDGEDGHTLEITAGAGDDTLGAIVTFGNVVIDLGDGANEGLIVSTSGFGVNDNGEEFARDITITTGGEGSSTVFADINASGRVLYQGGDGDDTTGVIESGVGGRGGNNRDGNRGAQGQTEGVIVLLGGGTNATDDISADDGFAVVVGGDGDDSIGNVDVDGVFDYYTLVPETGLAQANPTGEAIVDLGGGTNRTGVLTSRLGTVRYTGGDGDDFVGGRPHDHQRRHLRLPRPGGGRRRPAGRLRRRVHPTGRREQRRRQRHRQLRRRQHRLRRRGGHDRPRDRRGRPDRGQHPPGVRGQPVPARGRRPDRQAHGRRHRAGQREQLVGQ